MRFIRSFIRYHRLHPGKKSKFYADLQKIGNSVTDIYCGGLTLSEILKSIEIQLKYSDHLSRGKYQAFIESSQHNFRIVKLIDGSEWTLLCVNDSNRYIHVHPARGGVLIVRAKANALKTAIVLKTIFSHELEQNDLVPLINKVRIELIHESPIKDMKDALGIRKVLDLLLS